MTAVSLCLPGDLLTLNENKWSNTLETVIPTGPLTKCLHLNTTNCIILWKAGTVASQKRIQTPKYFPSVWSSQYRKNSCTWDSGSLDACPCEVAVALAVLLGGKPMQDAAAWRWGRCGFDWGCTCVWGWSGPGAPGWTPGHLDTGCDGYLGHCAGEQTSGITARTQAGRFALWKNSSNLQIAPRPGCVLVNLALTWTKRSRLSPTLGKKGEAFFIPINVNVQWNCSLTFMPPVPVCAFLKKKKNQEAKVCCSCMCIREKGGTSACGVKFGMQLYCLNIF